MVYFTTALRSNEVVLEKLLRNELCPADKENEQNLALILKQKLQKKDKEGNNHEK